MKRTEFVARAAREIYAQQYKVLPGDMEACAKRAVEQAECLAAAFEAKYGIYDRTEEDELINFAGFISDSIYYAERGKRLTEAEKISEGASWLIQYRREGLLGSLNILEK